MSGGETYEEEEQVLARADEQLYRAKVIQVDEGKDKPYKVHYHQWAKKWDVWVGADSLLKITPENLQIQEEQKKKRAAALKKVEEEKAKAAERVASKKRKLATKSSNKGKSKAPPKKRPLLRLTLPKVLREQLLADRASVVDENMLVSLPRTPSVDQILSDFTSKLRGLDEETKTVVEGVKTYFDQSLDPCLLYPPERAQFKDIHADHSKKSSSELYGPEHLLRLFVKLPEFLQEAPWNMKERKVVEQKLGDLLTYLQKKREALFTREEYVPNGSVKKSK